MLVLIIDSDVNHANGMRTRFLNKYAVWTVNIAIVGNGVPSGSIVTYQPSVELCVDYAINNSYKIILYANTNVSGFEDQWKRAFNAGIQPIVADGSNTHTELQYPPYLYRALEVSGGLITCERSYGFIECFDASTDDETEESWAAANYAARFAKVFDDYPNDNLFDIRQRLRQGCSYYSSGWISDGGYGRASDTIPTVPASSLDISPPIECAAALNWNNQVITFTWINYLQDRFNKTIIKKGDGEILYQGTDEIFEWRSDVTGNMIFKFYSSDEEGNLSREENHAILNVVNLQKYYAILPEEQSRFLMRSSLGFRKY